jgi:hypothetical protein
MLPDFLVEDMTMKSARVALGLVALALGLVFSGPALAGGHHGGNVHFGVVVGGPLWWGAGYPYGYPYYYPPYYYPPAYYAPYASSPPVYVEQDTAQPAPAPQAPQGYWYYCAGANGYYPYVKECPAGWQRVSPQPPPG